MSSLGNSLSVLNHKYDICVVGGEKVGKSNLIISYVFNRFIDEVNYDEEELYIKHTRTEYGQGEISILDTALFRDHHASSKKQQMINTSGFIFCYSITDQESLLEIEDIFERIYSLRDEMPPIVLVGLKSDLEQERQVSFTEGMALSERMNAVSFLECSAKSRVGVDEAFEPLVRLISKEHKLSILSKSEDMTSLQSLREVLSSPVESLDNTVFPSTPDKSSTNSRVCNKFDADSISIEIPKFHPDRMTSHQAHNETRTSTKRKSVVSTRSQKTTKSLARTTSEKSKNESRCCVIM